MSTEHGCCPDNFTPAQGPGNAGCLCHTYEYGCCPDGKAIARGPGQVSNFSHLAQKNQNSMRVVSITFIKASKPLMNKCDFYHCSVAFYSTKS